MAAQSVLLLAWVVLVLRGGDLPGWIRAVGGVAAAAGAVLAVAGFAGLGRNLTPFPEPVSGGELVEHGVYAIVRHPMYGGVALGAIGLGLTVGSVAAAVVGVGLLGFFALKARGEERRLEAAYPGYAGYRQRVRAALLPWIG